MYNAFWRHALFVRGQSFSVKTFDRSRNGCQVIGEGEGNDFRGPSVQALPLPSRVSFSRARFFLRPLLPSACKAGYYFSGHNNDLLVLKQWKGVFNRIMPSLFSLLPLLCKNGLGLKHYPVYINFASLRYVLLTFFTVFFKICKIIS